MLGARDEDAEVRYLEVYKEENTKIKRCNHQNKKEVNEQFKRKMNQDMNKNRKLFWKEIGKANDGKRESCSKIKD